VIRALVALCLVACAHDVPVAGAPKVIRVDAWCYDALVEWRGRPHSATGCFDTKALCERALGLARENGSLAGITHLTECR
jgi:hypothetical protein